MTWLQNSQTSAQWLLQNLPAPDALVVCGSGASGLPRMLGEVIQEVQVSSIPLWPTPQAAGHGSTLTAVLVEGTICWVATGRVHLYDGLGIGACAHAVRTAHQAGAQRVVLTNAAGSLHEAWPVGSVVSLSDHINMLGQNPLCGTPPAGVERFVATDATYDQEFLEACLSFVRASGVYAAMLGPSYETRAEIRMLGALGADLVGMSTVPEALAARQLQMRVAAFSVVSNLATGVGPSSTEHDHQDVLRRVQQATTTLAQAVKAVLTAK
jgi:purine-nucleoside phosphorylase